MVQLPSDWEYEVFDRKVRQTGALSVMPVLRLDKGDEDAGTTSSFASTVIATVAVIAENELAVVVEEEVRERAVA